MVTHVIPAEVAQRLIISLMIPVKRGLSWRLELASITMHLLQCLRGAVLREVRIEVTGWPKSDRSADSQSYVNRLVRDHKTTPTW